MAESPVINSKILRSFIEASAGSKTNFQLNFWGQFVMGLLYSLGHLPFHAVGVLLGFVLPGIWVFCTYRLIKASADKEKILPFPGWMQKDPGNALVIIIDIVFLAIIWALIISGLFSKIWVKILFTVAFPLLTLSMLRNLIHLLSLDDSGEKEQ